MDIFKFIINKGKITSVDKVLGIEKDYYVQELGCLKCKTVKIDGEIVTNIIKYD